MAKTAAKIVIKNIIVIIFTVITYRSVTNYHGYK